MAPSDADVIVIGSGAGGGAAAWALTRLGARVLLLEAGPEYDPHADYRLDRDDWEQTGFPAKMSHAERQTHAPLQVLEDRWSDLRSWNHLVGRTNTTSRRRFRPYSHVVGLGGSTLHFTGEAHRLNPASMRMRSRFGVAADWPLTYPELEPFYAEAERIVGVAGPAEGSGRPRSAPYPLPAHPLSYATQRLVRGCAALGLTMVPNSIAALSQPYDDRPPCNYCGNCGRGCPRLDKGSVDITFIRRARESGRCDVRTLSPVVRLETGPGDRIAGVVYTDDTGITRRAAAPAVIVACGAVETPRLLLNSADSRALDGLANESGQVGRNFMETISWVSSGLHPDPLGSHRGLPSDGICWDYNAPDAIPGVVGGCRFSAAHKEIGLNGPIAYAGRVVGGWGRAHKARMRETFGRALSVGAIGENLPNPRAFIDLDPDKRDRAGQPLARIHSHLGETEFQRLAFMAKTARAILDASGAGTLIEEFGSYDTFHSTHVFGTCRMGDDPETSVVDRFGRSHRWRNLFIADASVFPSSGGGESPSLTIEALALRTADHVVRLARRGAL